MQGNLPVSFGKGATEKGWKAPRRCPTSFGEGQLEKGHRKMVPRQLPTQLRISVPKNESPMIQSDPLALHLSIRLMAKQLLTLLFTTLF